MQLTVTNLAKAFGTHEIFKDVSFTVAKGEHIGLVGVNGSGKTTLLKCLLDPDYADSGTIAFEAGLQAGDIITRIDSTDITAAHVAMDLIAETRPGQVIKVTVRRGNGVVTVPVRVAEDQVERQVN